MIKAIVCCDVCGRPLKVEQVKTPIGIVERIHTFKCKEWDISSIAPDLCELCQLKIDFSVSKIRQDYAIKRTVPSDGMQIL